MTQYGIDDAILVYNTKTMTAYITDPAPDLTQTNETEDGTPLGATIIQKIFTGLTDYGTVAVGGPYDDTAVNGPDAVFGAAARAKTLATLVLTWGGSKTTTITNVGVSDYKRTVAHGAVTKYSCTLFCGAGAAVTEA